MNERHIAANHRQCPFCARLLEVYEITEPKARSVGLVYLCMRCTSCNVKIEGAGVGMKAALAQLDASRDKRVGTTIDQWRVKTGARQRRKR